MKIWGIYVLFYKDLDPVAYIFLKNVKVDADQNAAYTIQKFENIQKTQKVLDVVIVNKS